MKTFVVFILSTLLAFAATALLASIAESNHWCCVHSWALMHGSGLIVLMLIGLVGYHVITFLGIRFGLLQPYPRFGWLSHTAYLSSAFGTLFITEDLMWIGLTSSIAAFVQRFRGREVMPFGLAIMGLFISLLTFSHWAYITWLF